MINFNIIRDFDMKNLLSFIKQHFQYENLKFDPLAYRRYVNISKLAKLI